MPRAPQPELDVIEVVEEADVGLKPNAFIRATGHKQPAKNKGKSKATATTDEDIMEIDAPSSTHKTDDMPFVTQLQHRLKEVWPDSSTGLIETNHTHRLTRSLTLSRNSMTH